MKMKYLIALTLSLLLLSTSTIVFAQTDLQIDDYEKALSLFDVSSALSNPGDLAEENNIGMCILSASTSSIAELSECDDDPTCRSTILLTTVLEILNCANPDDENFQLLMCFVDAAGDISQLQSSCEQNQLCVLRNIASIVFDIINCNVE